MQSSLGTCLARLSFITRRHFSFTVKSMAELSVRCVQGEDRLNLCLEYSPQPEQKPRCYRLDRLKTESLGSVIKRLQSNILSKSANKKKKKKLEGQNDEEEVLPVINVEHNGQIVNMEDSVEKVFVPGTIMKIESQIFNVVLNPPSVVKLKLPCSIMVGFPLFPNISTEFTDLNHSEFIWFRVKIKPTAAKRKPNTDVNDEDFSECIEVSKSLVYTPNVDDLGYMLMIKCTPKSENMTGKMCQSLSTCEVTPGPGMCPFETRHLFTMEATNDKSFRVMTYNILADLYADSEYTRNILYPYCANYALAFDYRKQLLLKEIIGYNADVMCMQEVDKRAFVSIFQPCFEKIGFLGAQCLKDGSINEGEVVFYRTSKFSLVQEHNIVLRDSLAKEEKCADILSRVKNVKKVMDVINKKTTVLQVVVLERNDKPNHKLIVGNTHLFFHPTADNIRMVQSLICVRHLEEVMSMYKQQGNEVSVIFCGDFNSRPARGVHTYMTTGQVREDLEDWIYISREKNEKICLEDMNFTHSLHLDSGCGYPRYTNYVGGFHEMLDYVFMDRDTLEVEMVVPSPEHEEVVAHTALPSVVFPSDHIAQICDLKWKET